MATETEISIATIKQTSCMIDYDWGVGGHAVANFFEEAEKFLMEHGQKVTGEFKALPWLNEGIISPPIANSGFKLLECLVDNKFRPSYHGVTHEFILAGQPERVEEVKFLLGTKVHRWKMLCSLPRQNQIYDRYAGKWSITNYPIPENFSLYYFPSAQAVKEYLAKTIT